MKQNRHIANLILVVVRCADVIFLSTKTQCYILTVHHYTDTRPASLDAFFVSIAQPVLNTAQKPRTDFHPFPLLGWLTLRKTKVVITYKQNSNGLPHKWLVCRSYLKSPLSWHNQKEQKKAKAVICCPFGFSRRIKRLASSINTRLQRQLCN